MNIDDLLAGMVFIGDDADDGADVNADDEDIIDVDFDDLV